MSSQPFDPALSLLASLGEVRPATLDVRLGLSPGRGAALCGELARRGLARALTPGLYAVTPAGRAAAVPAGRLRSRRRVDEPIDWQAQHGDLACETRSLTDDSGKVTGVREGLVNRGGSPLDRYCARRQLDADAGVNQRRFQAGDRFRTDRFLGGLDPNLVRNLSAAGPSTASPGHFPGLTATDRQLAARSRWRAAIAALGPALMPVAVGVCCDARLASDFGSARRAASRQIEGLTALRLALDTLAAHYRL